VVVVAEAEDQDICTVAAGALACGTDDNADGKPDTLQELATRIASLGGPAYDAAFDRDGHDARGIVSAFLYRTDRVQLLPAFAGPAVSYPTAPAPYDADVSNPKALNAALPADATADADGTNVFTRAAQLAHFRIWRTATGLSTFTDVWAVANHFSSGPDGRVAQRRQQAAYNAAIVNGLLAAEPGAKVMVAGDLNTYPRPDDPFDPPSDQLGPLYDAAHLHALFDTLVEQHPSSAYSYVFSGQAQDLDHQFVTQGFFDRLKASTSPMSTPTGRPTSRTTATAAPPTTTRWSRATPTR
jgi:predicted extracellular nuclease